MLDLNPQFFFIGSVSIGLLLSLFLQFFCGLAKALLINRDGDFDDLFD
jgi:hypothetical protein